MCTHTPASPSPASFHPLTSPFIIINSLLSVGPWSAAVCIPFIFIFLIIFCVICYCHWISFSYPRSVFWVFLGRDSKICTKRGHFSCAPTWSAGLATSLLRLTVGSSGRHTSKHSFPILSLILNPLKLTPKVSPPTQERCFLGYHFCIFSFVYF